MSDLLLTGGLIKGCLLLNPCMLKGMRGENPHKEGFSYFLGVI